jgi:hypothetical protein
MSVEKKMRRARKKEQRRAAREHYRKNRDLGACFVKDCQNNGDLTTHCELCEFKVQACTDHSEAGRDKAKRHLLLKHPAKTLPTLVLGVLRGQSLE